VLVEIKSKYPITINEIDSVISNRYGRGQIQVSFPDYEKAKRILCDFAQRIAVVAMDEKSTQIQYNLEGKPYTIPLMDYTIPLKDALYKLGFEQRQEK